MKQSEIKKAIRETEKSIKELSSIDENQFKDFRIRIAVRMGKHVGLLLGIGRISGLKTALKLTMIPKP